LTSGREAGEHIPLSPKAAIDAWHAYMFTGLAFLPPPALGDSPFVRDQFWRQMDKTFLYQRLKKPLAMRTKQVHFAS
jgi:hypothetical protein